MDPAYKSCEPPLIIRDLSDFSEIEYPHILRHMGDICESSTAEDEIYVISQSIDTCGAIIVRFIDFTWRDRTKRAQTFLASGASDSAVLSLLPSGAEMAFSCTLPSKTLISKVAFAACEPGFSHGACTRGLSWMAAFLRAAANVVAQRIHVDHSEKADPCDGRHGKWRQASRGTRSIQPAGLVSASIHHTSPGTDANTPWRPIDDTNRRQRDLNQSTRLCNAAGSPTMPSSQRPIRWQWWIAAALSAVVIWAAAMAMLL